MQANPLWVTSFSARIFQQSGLPLLKSYIAHGNTFSFFLGLEDIDTIQHKLPTHDAFKKYDLGTDTFLATWLKNNADIVPPEFGGQARLTCVCPGGPYTSTDKKHKPRCRAAWFNYNAGRWFRKVAAMNAACSFARDSGEFSSIIWIDADSLFTAKITPETVASWFKGCDAFYVKASRPVLEAGVFGFNLTSNGYALLDRYVARYRDGHFRKDDRWDDSPQLQAVLLAPGVSAIDLAYGTSGHADVVPNSLLKDFITHDKGRHGRKLGIFK